MREIYRALILSRSYSKETILEAYLNTISFTGTIQGVQTAANEYFDKDVSELTLWECASIASITKNPTNYNPYTNPENLINRRNFLLYNMWQQGVISEEDYRSAAAQPLVLAETDNTKKSSSTTSYFTDALFNEVVKDIMAKEGVDESTAQSMLYTGGYTIEATVNPKIQTAMENLMLNTDDAYFPAGWHEEEVTSISDDDVQVFNEDGTPKTRTGEDGTVYYYRNVRTQAAMVTLDYDGNVIAMVGGLGEKTKSLSLNRAYGVTRQTGSTIKPIGAYALGIEYGLVNWSTMLNNSPLYLKQDMVIRDEDYCRRNGLMGLTDKQLKAYPNSNGMEAFGKTGTASDEKDLWFVGGTPYYVTAVWWGYDAPFDMTQTLGKQQAKTRTCVMAWKALMEQVQADLPYKAFPAADGVVERSYCTQSGLLASGSCPSTAVGYYRADDLPDVCNYSHGQAAVASQPLAPEPDTTNLDTD